MKLRDINMWHGKSYKSKCLLNQRSASMVKAETKTKKESINYCSMYKYYNIEQTITSA